MCMIDDSVQNDFWQEHSRTARKEHKCGECYRPIRKGEQYWYASGKSEGRIYNSKMCRHCHVVADWLVRNCRGYLYSEVMEDFRQHAEANMPMLRLVIGARRQWVSFTNPAALMPVPPDVPDMI